jgi:nucleoside-diphosphate-sugar epimerase
VYDETKAAGHEIAAAMAAIGLPVVTVQPGVVYGPGDTSQLGGMIRDVVAGRRPAVPSGGGGCWGYVDDIARGHVLAMERGRAGESYMLAGPRSTLSDALRMAATLAGTKGPRTLPRAMVRAAAALAGAVGNVVPLPDGFAAESAHAALASYLGSPAKAERELGWTARSLGDGMELTVAALRTA